LNTQYLLESTDNSLRKFWQCWISWYDVCWWNCYGVSWQVMGKYTRSLNLKSDLLDPHWLINTFLNSMFAKILRQNSPKFS